MVKGFAKENNDWYFLKCRISSLKEMSECLQFLKRYRNINTPIHRKSINNISIITHYTFFFFLFFLLTSSFSFSIMTTTTTSSSAHSILHSILLLLLLLNNNDIHINPTHDGVVCVPQRGECAASAAAPREVVHFVENNHPYNVCEWDGPLDG